MIPVVRCHSTGCLRRHAARRTNVVSEQCCWGTKVPSVGLSHAITRSVSFHLRLPKRFVRPSRMRTRSPECNVIGINGGSASEYGLGGDTFRRHGCLLARRRVSPRVLRAGGAIGRTVASLPCYLLSTVSARQWFPSRPASRDLAGKEPSKSKLTGRKPDDEMGGCTTCQPSERSLKR
jgi:hypothetical protein